MLRAAGEYRRATWRCHLIWLVVLLVVLLVAAAVPVRADIPRSVFVMAKALDDVITLDPAEAFEFSATEILANVYQRLFRPNPDDPANPIPDLVESWSVAPDGRTFRFSLISDAQFHSGHPVTAADAAYSLQRAVRLNLTPAFILTQLGLTRDNVGQKVRAAGPHELVIEIDKAYAPSLVLNVLSAVVASVVDSRLLESKAQDNDFGHGWLRRNSAGSAAFALRRWQPGEYLMLDRIDDAPLKRVVIQDIREPATQRLMLVRGDIDMARNLGPDQIAALADDPAIATQAVPGARIYYLGLNQNHPILAKPEIRTALRYLIDYHKIAETVLAGRVAVHQAFLPIGIFAALTEAPFGLDVERARDLLREAGHGDGFDITMDARSDALNMQIAQAIQATMAEAGVRLEIIPGEGKQVLTKYRARRHDIYIGQWGPDYLDPHSNAAAFARNPDNSDASSDKTLAWRNSWEIPALTGAAERAMHITDAQVRAASYDDLQRRVQDDSPFIVMFQESGLIAARAEVTGFVPGLTSDQTDYRGIVKH